MDAETVRTKVKDIISTVTGIEVEDIGDGDSFVDDLSLDSLSLLEIGVDVDYEFKLGVPEERLASLKTVEDAVTMVLEHLAAKTGAAGAT